LQHYHDIRASYVIIFIVQQNYFQICIYLAKFLDTSAKQLFPWKSVR